MAHKSPMVSEEMKRRRLYGTKCESKPQIGRNVTQGNISGRDKMLDQAISQNMRQWEEVNAREKIWHSKTNAAVWDGTREDTQSEWIRSCAGGRGKPFHWTKRYN